MKYISRTLLATIQYSKNGDTWAYLTQFYIGIDQIENVAMGSYYISQLFDIVILPKTCLGERRDSYMRKWNNNVHENKKRYISGK